MHHPVFGIIFLPHSVNLVHHLSPTSHHPSLPLSSIPDLKLTFSTNPSHHRSSPIHRTAHWTAFMDSVPLSVMFFCYLLLVDACVGLNWLSSSFWSHVNKTTIHSKHSFKWKSNPSPLLTPFPLPQSLQNHSKQSIWQFLHTWKSAVVRMCRESGLQQTSIRPAEPSSILHVHSGCSSDQTWDNETVVMNEICLKLLKTLVTASLVWPVTEDTLINQVISEHIEAVSARTLVCMETNLQTNKLSMPPMPLCYRCYSCEAAHKWCTVPTTWQKQVWCVQAIQWGKWQCRNPRQVRYCNAGSTLLSY